MPCTTPWEIRLKEMSIARQGRRVRVDRRLVERVDLLAPDGVHRRALGLERACDRAAERAVAAVDDRMLVL